jgi:hypothetical protein
VLGIWILFGAWCLEFGIYLSMVKENKTEKMNMKDELQRMRLRLKEENEALMKLILELEDRETRRRGD